MLVVTETVEIQLLFMQSKHCTVVHSVAHYWVHFDNLFDWYIYIYQFIFCIPKKKRGGRVKVVAQEDVIVFMHPYKCLLLIRFHRTDLCIVHTLAGE